MKKIYFIFFLFILSNNNTFGQNNPAKTEGEIDSLAKNEWAWDFQVTVSRSEPLQKAYELPASDVDFEGFMELSNQVFEHRKERLVDLVTFLEMSKDSNTVILDTRSANAFEMIRLAGAVHLNFSDFTTEKLAEIIPSNETRILIYCNNNFKGTPFYFPSKRKKLALNIPTYINLYGYGYENIYELKDLLPFPTDLVDFERGSFP